eukprot:TRINITY_DN16215_c0_g2_i1.p1 TRINITY_DN16215_c0_g2~~TRINITY_DN16215_c0_g2_i1.p1  ORF type:complete len:174 (-),score=21.77 TRINITY_DN16215_c0_g2_i1:166-687(-)
MSASRSRSRSRTKKKGSKSRSPEAKKGKGRSRSKSGDMDERTQRHKEKIDDFASDKKLDERATRILQNMHPVDSNRVMDTPFPEDVRNTVAFVISTIRKVENETGRPQGYRWDGRSWSEPPKGYKRSPNRYGGGQRGGRRDRRDRRDRSDSRRSRRRRSPSRRRRRRSSRSRS